MIIASGQVDRELSRDFQYLQGTWHSYYFQLPFAEETVAHNDFAFIEEWWRWASAGVGHTGGGAGKHTGDLSPAGRGGGRFGLLPGAV